MVRSSKKSNKGVQQKRLDSGLYTCYCIPLTCRADDTIMKSQMDYFKPRQDAF